MKLYKYVVGGLLLLSNVIATSEAKADWCAQDACCVDQCCEPPGRWNGFYVGGNAGAICHVSKEHHRHFGRFDDCSFRNRRSGFTGGVQVGYNWQSCNWVYGLETDLNYSSIRHRRHHEHNLFNSRFVHHESHHRTHWFGTLRPRVGFTWCDDLFIYATGGLAYGKLNFGRNHWFSWADDHWRDNNSKVHYGWTVGAGLEYAFDCNWSVKFDYLFLDFKKHNFRHRRDFPSDFRGFEFSPSWTNQYHVARIGVNYTI